MLTFGAWIKRVKLSQMKENAFKTTKNQIVTIFATFVFSSLMAQDGSQIFQSNCAVCHKISNAKFVGPGMAGITNRRSESWLKSWIRDSQGLIATGDSDAKAIYAEFNNSVMPPFPQFSDAELAALVTYLGTLSEGANVETEVPEVEIVYSDTEIAQGKRYFTGLNPFFNGGPSCISCHDVSEEGVDGGYLAKDLTDVYVRLGEAGIMAMVSNAPFPAMNNAYANSPVTQAEQKSIAAFLKSVSSNSPESRASGVAFMTLLGSGGFVTVLILIMITWRHRKKHSVKAQIFARQIRSIN